MNITGATLGGDSATGLEEISRSPQAAIRSSDRFRVSHEQMASFSSLSSGPLATVEKRRYDAASLLLSRYPKPRGRHHIYSFRQARVAFMAMAGWFTRVFVAACYRRFARSARGLRLPRLGATVYVRRWRYPHVALVYL